jgi:hypothetical protein
MYLIRTTVARMGLSMCSTWSKPVVKGWLAILSKRWAPHMNDDRFAATAGGSGDRVDSGME